MIKWSDQDIPELRRTVTAIAPRNPVVPRREIRDYHGA
jgi:hypothetical protein